MSGLQKEIMYNGVRWRLLYDPNDPTTMLPDVSAKCQVERVSREEVMLNGTRYYMNIVDLLYPSISTPTVRRPALRVRGFRLTTSPIDPNTTPPETMIMYGSEVQSGEDGAQQFLDAVARVPHNTTINSEDIEWTKALHADAHPAIDAVSVEAPHE